MHRFVILVALLSTVASVFGGESDVLVFTDNDFQSRLEEQETVLVMFYAPWCGHCKKLKPEFEKAASMVKNDDPPISFAKVDCTEDGKDTCGKHGVSGYPTLKIFKSGELSQEYSGPRDANGIVKYMRAQVGPSAKELKSADDVENFISKEDAAVVGFFSKADSKVKVTLEKLADKLRESHRFGYTLASDALEKYKYSDEIVLFRPKKLQSKFEPSSVKYEGENNKEDVEKWLKKNLHGLVGVRTSDTVRDFKDPSIVAYYNVDYVKNAKGTNYWRNRIMKVAQNYADQLTFAISPNGEFQHELNEFGIDYVSGDKPQVCARDAKGKKFAMKDEFSIENLEKFIKEFLGGKLEPFVKSEPIPEDNSGPVTVAVANNFDDVVTNAGKDVLVEFYAPWCGHCKKLAPTFDELGEKLKDEDVSIVKMDATANDVPPTFDVRGFPTLYWVPKGKSPQRYEGGRDLEDFIKYIAKHSTSELKGWDRSGSAKKTEL